MKNLFSYDGPISKFGTRVSSLLLLNILTILSGIPIITIGTSLTAMHYVTFRIMNDKDPKVAKIFFKAFKQNFRKTTIIWLVYLLILLLLAIDFQIINSGISDNIQELKILLAAVTIFIVWVIIWTFILFSRYENSIILTIKNAVLMIIFYPGKSFIILVALLVPLVMCFLSYICLVFSIAFGFTISSYIQAMAYRNVFAQIEKKSQAGVEKDGSN